MSDEGTAHRTELPLEVLDRIDRACDRFEAAWEAGQRPRVEDYLGGVHDPYRAALLSDLLAAELDARRRLGEQPEPHEYEGRFPDDTAAVKAAFHAAVAPTLRTLRRAVIPPPDDRDALLALLALQTGLVDRPGVAGAFRAWAADRSRPLGEILATVGALDRPRKAFLETLTAGYLELHGGDVERCLGALPAGRATIARFLAPGGPLAGPDLDLPAGDGARMVGADAHADGPARAQRFGVLRPHARGGLGAVFVAIDRELNREVALKRMLDGHTDDPVSRTRFVMEAEITGGLEHPGVVPVYGLGTDAQGRPYYAMRFVRGDSLKEAIAEFHDDQSLKADPGRRSLALRQLLRRFLDVCNAIGYAHSRGVLHRDIKPGNIIVGEHGETLVVDWGLAKATGRVPEVPTPDERPLIPSSQAAFGWTSPGSVLGTPAYMSPEQAAGDLERMGPPSDVYSLGATLYHLLVGRPAFAGTDGSNLLARVGRGEFAPPRSVQPDLPHALEAVCLKAMALDPHARYPTPRALADDLERWLADEPTSALPETPAERLARWGRRHRTWIQAGAAALAALAVILVAALLVVDRARKAERRAREDALRSLLSDQAARAEALRQRNQAEAHFQTARKAVDDYLTRVSEDKLLKEEHLHDLRELRQKLLEAALPFYEGFVAQRGDDPGLQADLADAHFHIARIRDEIGSKQAAREEYARARAIREGLDTTDLRNGRALASCLLSLGALDAATGRPAEALLSLTRAREVLEGLAAAHPGDGDVQADLASALERLGVFCWGTRQPDEALRWSEQARVLRARLVAVTPADLRHRLNLAVSDVNVATLRSLMGGSPREFLAALERVRTTLEPMAAENPAVLLGRNLVDEVQVRLAAVYNNLGGAYLELGQRTDALKAFELGRDFQARLAASHPLVTDYQSRLAMFYHHIGIVHSQLKHPAEEAETYQKAREIRARLVAAHPTVSRFQGSLAGVQLDLGSVARKRGLPAEARRWYGEARAILERIPDPSPMELYNLTCAMVQSGAPAEQALHVLRRAIAAGSRNLRHTWEDSDLEPLRPRADFQALVLDPSFPPDPFAK